MKSKNQKKAKEKEDYVYLIKVNNEIVWEGTKPKSIFKKIQKENPDKRVSIAWELKEGVLVV